jgi:altronate dehydratase large subunit
MTGDYSIRVEGESADRTHQHFSFEGYKRSEDSIGVRDRVLVLPSVICSHIVADRIADGIEDAVSAPHDHGCAQIGSDHDQTKRTLLNVAQNPNIAGTLVIGLGCEHVQSDYVAMRLDELGETVRELSIQDECGTDPAIDQGIKAVCDLRQKTNTKSRPAGMDELTLGVTCSDLTVETIERAAPLVGKLADKVAAAEGRIVAAGIEPLITHPEAAYEAVTAEATETLDALLARHEGKPAKARTVERTARDRSFAAATRAWGEGPIQEILDYGEVASHNQGLAVVDAPSQFVEAATALVAAGAQVIIHITDEGIPTGHPVTPVVKVSGNVTTCEALSDDIDVDATAVSASDFEAKFADVIAGEQSRAEEHGVTDFGITRVGPSM